MNSRWLWKATLLETIKRIVQRKADRALAQTVHKAVLCVSLLGSGREQLPPPVP